MSLIIGHFLSDPSKRYRDFLGGYFLNFWNVIKNRAWFEKLQVEKRKKLFRVFFVVYALMMMGLFSISLT
jgi:hypothetical protein